MIIQLKILTGLSTEIVRMRETRIKYQTNRNIKAYALYTWLKNKTEAGIIHHYDKQLTALLDGSNISRSSFYRYLSIAEDLKLIKRKNGNLKLTGYQAILEDLFIHEKKFTYINFDTEKHKLDHIFNVLEVSENKKRQEKAIEVKISKHPLVLSAFKLFWISQGKPDQVFNLVNLQKAQKIIFETGTAERIYKPLMYSVNPEFNRCSNTIATAHNYKSPKSVTYFKRKLVKSKLISVLDVINPICAYNKNRIDGVQRGKNENANYVPYDPKKRHTTWYKPQQIIINPLLFIKL